MTALMPIDFADAHYLIDPHNPLHCAFVTAAIESESAASRFADLVERVRDSAERALAGGVPSSHGVFQAAAPLADAAAAEYAVCHNTAVRLAGLAGVTPAPADTGEVRCEEAS